MAQKQCGKCSEMVDEAKAFCPGCGNPFVDEQRAEASEYDSLGGTMQFGQSMYNQMLSDMGLNITDKPDAADKPVKSAPPVPQASVPEPEKTIEKHWFSGNIKWLIIGIAAVVLLFVVAALALMYYLLITRYLAN